MMHRDAQCLALAIDRAALAALAIRDEAPREKRSAARTTADDEAAAPHREARRLRNLQRLKETK